MANVNLVILAGNLTRDPEIRYTPTGTAIAKLGLAVNRRYKDQSGQLRDETTFVDIDVFGRQAEIASQYLSKGRSCLIEGELRLDQWEDKNSGQKRSKLKVLARRIQFLGGAGGGGGGGGGAHPQGQSGAQQHAQPVREPVSMAPQDLDIPEDDIPF